MFLLPYSLHNLNEQVQKSIALQTFLPFIIYHSLFIIHHS